MSLSTYPCMRIQGAMCDVEGVDVAAGIWLQRLHREEHLPSKSVLEILRRREAKSRQHVEAWADAEHRCAQLATMRLEDERQLHVKRAEKNSELLSTLRVERQIRLDAEVALNACQADLRAARADLEAEQTQRIVAERAEEKARKEISELRKLLEDDQSLQILEEFQEKFESQRQEIATLQQRLGIAQEATCAADAARCQLLRELEMARGRASEELKLQRQEASKELELVRYQGSKDFELACNQAAKELELVRNQAAKKLADVQASLNSTSDALALERQERTSLSNEIAHLREAGAILQNAVESTLSAWRATMERQDAEGQCSSESSSAGEDAATLQIAAQNVLNALQPLLLYHYSSVIYDQSSFPELGSSVPVPQVRSTLVG